MENLKTELESGDVAKSSQQSEPDEEKCLHQEAEGDSSEKIKQLLEKTAKMRLEAPERNRQAEEYFKKLRDQLLESSAFLQSARNNIENIKAQFEQDHIKNLNSSTYLDSLDKTDDEIEEEMRNVEQKLKELQGRISTLKQGTNSQSKSFEQAVKDTIAALNGLGKGEVDTTDDA